MGREDRTDMANEKGAVKTISVNNVIGGKITYAGLAFNTVLEFLHLQFSKPIFAHLKDNILMFASPTRNKSFGFFSRRAKTIKLCFIDILLLTTAL
ncbi:hypothetical protein M758_7G084900 [Ceratodon purpureus]|nr:hypothetical protein M758_7G084900 [Ceratodon purpureus]